MADNYLEKRQAEIAEGGARKVVRRTNPSLDTLLHRNRSYRGYDPSRTVTEQELRELVAATALTASFIFCWLSSIFFLLLFMLHYLYRIHEPRGRSTRKRLHIPLR